MARPEPPPKLPAGAGLLPARIRERVLEPALQDLAAERWIEDRRPVGGRATAVLLIQAGLVALAEVLWRDGRATRLARTFSLVLLLAVLAVVMVLATPDSAQLVEY